jgi:hypothetical protein
VSSTATRRITKLDTPVYAEIGDKFNNISKPWISVGMDWIRVGYSPSTLDNGLNNGPIRSISASYRALFASGIIGFFLPPNIRLLCKVELANSPPIRRRID